jgi:hypothetical protein
MHSSFAQFRVNEWVFLFGARLPFAAETFSSSTLMVAWCVVSIKASDPRGGGSSILFTAQRAPTRI